MRLKPYLTIVFFLQLRSKSQKMEALYQIVIFSFLSLQTRKGILSFPAYPEGARPSTVSVRLTAKCSGLKYRKSLPTTEWITLPTLLATLFTVTFPHHWPCRIDRWKERKLKLFIEFSTRFLRIMMSVSKIVLHKPVYNSIKLK